MVQAKMATSVRHLRTLFDLTPAQLVEILDIATDLKAGLARGDRPDLLKNQTIALLFEKQSLRTRVSFEVGMRQMGGGSLFLGVDVGWGQRETPADFTRVLGGFVDAVVCRAKSHDRVEELARYNVVPIINGLTDLCHPCQAIADLLTIRESLGGLRGLHVVFIGDGNNVARSLALGLAMVGGAFTLASPAGYQIDEPWLARIAQQYPAASLRHCDDPAAAVRDADVLYTDVWTSMGQEAESKVRRQAFAAFQINDALLNIAPSSVRVLHCLPATRGEEITDAVIEGPASDIFAQAENRMHAQKALLVHLLG